MPIDEFIIKIYLMVDDYYKKMIQQHIVKQYGQDNIHFIDGFPIPVCQYAR
nr:hypothetical protein [Moraxella osloensis]